MDQPLVKYFGSRPDGSLTPLVPVDELPDHISIRGVPPRLSIEQSYGMTGLSMSDQRPVPFVVDIRNVPATRAPGSSRGASSPHEMHTLNAGDDVAMHTHNRMNPNHLQVGPQLGRKAWNDFAAIGAAGGAGAIGVFYGPPAASFAGPPSGASRAGARTPNSTKKIYCSYWIRHGECDYEQQGCLYKHEMPLDREALEALGLRDVPKWYRDRYHIPSLIETPPHRQITHGRHVRQLQYPPRATITSGTTAVESAPKQARYIPKLRTAIAPHVRTPGFKAPENPVGQDLTPKRFAHSNAPVTGNLIDLDYTPRMPASKFDTGKVLDADEESDGPIKAEYDRDLIQSLQSKCDDVENVVSPASGAASAAQSRKSSPLERALGRQ